MEDEKKPSVILSEEQLDALAQSLLPVMHEFFNSKKGWRIWEEHLAKIELDRDSAAGHCHTKKLDYILIYQFKALAKYFGCGIIIL